MPNPQTNEHKKCWDSISEAPLEKNQREQIKSRIFDSLSLNERNTSSGSAFSKYAYGLGAAASLLFLAAVLIGLHLNTDPADTGLESVEYHTSTGETKKMQLSDGTQVWLNAGSRLSVPAGYNHKDRVISLKGEAYFEVQPDSLRPFRVQSNGLSTQVLGTKFNVRSYPVDSLQYISVIEGKVRVKKEVLDATSSINNEKHIDLVAGEQVQTDLMKPLLVKKREVNISRVMAWRNGILQFNQSPLKQVAGDLYRRFGITMRFAKPELKEARITGKFDTESWKEIIEMICLSTGLDYKTTESTVTIY